MVQRTKIFVEKQTKPLLEVLRTVILKNANESKYINELWTVLEKTEDRDGYKIYFDEDSKILGLAMKSDKDELMDIGGYYSFF